MRFYGKNFILFYVQNGCRHIEYKVQPSSENCRLHAHTSSPIFQLEISKFQSSFVCSDKHLFYLHYPHSKNSRGFMLGKRGAQVKLAFFDVRWSPKLSLSADIVAFVVWGGDSSCFSYWFSTCKPLRRLKIS